MLFKRTKYYEDFSPDLEKNKLIILTKKLLPDMVFNMASLEGNPFTYPEVQTLLEGITIGGHKLSDEQQVLRIRDGWNFIFESARRDKIDINKELQVLIERSESNIDLAFDIFLWSALNQFYYEGNKRTSRLVSNLILIFNVKVKNRLEFNTLMVDFYNNHDADKIFEFFYDYCLEKY